MLARLPAAALCCLLTSGCSWTPVNDQRPADVRDELAGQLLVIREIALRRKP
jgi:hypothetical protein